ncbi:putative Non-specific protein-tyrosine kinase [endosymbiont DhMRE of Dentiscutata heterogama]|uniref:protein kinase n=1 Tax=endosymbiont DhMRE of Dentiscutata heterogama TaxID=1609546 RepID=UPI000629DCBD|nr:protein kinase [endosymbiont DhMRE of Dentiscutata heterogama]CFW92770.1 putative Non-specific protein-tyrosine kinase [endosymbiont DhMRE of Dentiscutata heterogama]
MVNWKDIHQDFTSELQKKWENKDFEYEKTEEWINLGLNPTDIDYACWLRDIKQIDTEWVKNNNLVDLLREEFNNSEYRKRAELVEERMNAILLIGNTGKGKSTLANVLIGRKKEDGKLIFKESDRSASETKEIQTEKFKENGLNYLIIDTPGMDDNREELPTEKILDIVAEAVYLVRNGVNQVLFVVSGRFNEYEMATYDLLRVVIFSEEITNYTTVIRTKFVNFRNSEKCNKDIVEMEKEDGRLSEIIKSCHGKIVHVDNDNDKKRQKSREKLLNHLTKECLDIYKPPKLQNLSDKIFDDMKEKKRLEEALEERTTDLKTKRKKIIRKLKTSERGNHESKTNKVSKSNDSIESVNESATRGKEKEQKNDNPLGLSQIEQKEIRELEKEREKLRKEIQEKVQIIRKKIFDYILENYKDIEKIEGGHIFISNINSNNSKEITKIKEEKVERWLIKNLDYLQTWELIDRLENNLDTENCLPFCFWLMNNRKLTEKKVPDDDEIKRWIDEYRNQLKKDNERLKLLDDQKDKNQESQNLQSWESLKEILKQNFKNWTSGSYVIDKFIQELQLKANNFQEILEWIYYEKFFNIEYLAEGGFGKVYKAVWADGPIKSWNIESDSWEREKNKAVALKTLNDFGNKFLQEISYHKLFSSDNSIINCYGISQDSKTKNYSMVIDYIPDGNLRKYLSENRLEFEDKLYQLYTIAFGLEAIHGKGLVHHDFHPGNILVDDLECYIIDFGLSRSVDERGDDKLYGVLPYVAPEVLMEKQYTKAADIYSFGMVGYELFTGKPPYDSNLLTRSMTRLSLEICRGLRPQFKIKIPQLLEDLIKHCWDANPAKRPIASELERTLSDWYNEMEDKSSEFYWQVRESEEHNKSLLTANPEYKTHTQAIYTSRLLDFKNLSEPQNNFSQVWQDSTLLELQIKGVEEELKILKETYDEPELIEKFIQVNKKILKNEADNQTKSEVKKLKKQLKEKCFSRENIEAIIRYCEELVDLEQKSEKVQAENLSLASTKIKLSLDDQLQVQQLQEPK